MSRIFEAMSRGQQAATALPPIVPDIAPAVVSESPDFNFEKLRQLKPVLPADSRLVTLQNGSLGSEKFRVLAARLRNVQKEYNLKHLLITSSGPEEGKTLVAANLAIALAKLPDEKVLLLEGDLRKPALAQMLGIFPAAGLVHHLEQNEDLHNCLYKFSDRQLWVLPAGTRSDRALDGLQSSALDEAFATLSRCFDWILIDSPPLLPTADTNVLARRADGILLVVREGRTSKQDLKQGLAGLDNSNVVATVLNDCSSSNGRYGHYYGHS